MKIKILKILAVGLSVCLVVILGGWLYFENMYGQMNYVTEDTGSSLTSSEKSEIDKQLQEEDSTSTTEDSPQEEILSAEDRILQNLKDNATQMVSSDEVFNILLIGTDHRENVDGDRSDSMIVVSINEKTKELTMTSFMRDCYVQIPGYGNNRLNAAYAYGGADLLIETLETNFKIKIDRFVKVGFDSFIEAIDAVGGVDMEVSDAEMKVMNDYIREINWLNKEDSETDVLTESGLIHMNGKQALSFSRIRYVGNADFGRTERQRNVLTAVFNKMKNANIIQLNDLLNKILPNVVTNITKGECFSLILSAPDYLKYSLASNRVPYDGTWQGVTIRGMSVLSVDFDENIANIQRDIYHIGEENIEDTQN